MHAAHLDDEHVLLMVKWLPLEIGRQLIVPPVMCGHDVKRMQPQRSGWVKRADDAGQGTVSESCRMLLQAVPSCVC